MENTSYVTKLAMGSPTNHHYKGQMPTCGLSAASPRNCGNNRGLSPRPLQEKTSNVTITNGAILPKEFSKPANLLDAKKNSRPPTGLHNNTKKQNVTLQNNMQPVPPVKKLSGLPKLTHWLNMGTMDPKNRTQSNAKLRGFNEPVSPLANKLKIIPVQSNENKFLLMPKHNENGGHGADSKNMKLQRNQTNQFITGAAKAAGNYVSPRCSKKSEQINLNTSANIMTNNTIADYNIMKQVGQGAYAIVKEAIHKITNNHVAIKVYDKLKLLDPQRKKSVNREIQILQKLSHPHIVKLYETIDSIKQLYLVMEFIKGKSLYSYLKSKDGRRLSENEARRIFKQVLEGIQYCHKRNVSHRDIKLENILMTETNDIKIIDFGFSTCYPPGTKLRVFCGTPSYMSPEIVTKKDYYGPPADMWALGILLYAMISGRFPFKGSSDRELYRNIAKGEFQFSSSSSSKAKALIKRLLQVDPNKRPTCDEVLNDPFMGEGNEKENPPKLILGLAKYNQEIIQKIVFFSKI